LDAEVDLDAALFEPTASALGEIWRFCLFGDAKQQVIEGARFRLTAGGHGQLNMIERLDRHAAAPELRANGTIRTWWPL
jgi:tRNA(Leu) C34 or U34 (ribose-2'-O)-methylase TrmL